MRIDSRKNYDDLEISARTHTEEIKLGRGSAVKVCEIASQNCVTHKITYLPAHLAGKTAEILMPKDYAQNIVCSLKLKL